jgi:hypothetical protein
MLVLLMGVIYEVHNRDGLRWHDLCTKFMNMKIGLGIQGTLRLLP